MPTYLLFIMLTVVVIGLGAFIFWQFGSPESDKSLPAISGIGVAFKGKTSAQIIWQTDTPCSSQVEYGRTARYGFMEPVVPINDPITGKSTGVISHSVTLTNLKAGYTYHYRVKSKNAAGNESISNDFSFKTDSAAPFVVPD
ncbi:fibronectin type III domain-containing protein [Chloroflexota bacterium]